MANILDAGVRRCRFESYPANQRKIKEEANKVELAVDYCGGSDVYDRGSRVVGGVQAVDSVETRE